MSGHRAQGQLDVCALHGFERGYWGRLAAGGRRHARAHGRGQMLGQDFRAVAHDGGSFDHVKEFADITGPLVLLEDLARGGREPPRAAETLVHPGDEVIRQRIDVAPPLAKRRQQQPDRGQTVEQVLAEEALLHHGLEVPVRGGQHPHVDPDLRGGADTPKRRRIEHTQQLDLRREAHLADLVEENRPPVCHLEQPGFRAIRAGEGAALVPEQLALQQTLLQRGAFDDDKWAVAPGAARMNQLRDHFLAGTGLARDEHRGVGRRDPLDEREHLTERIALADKRIAEVGRRQPSLEKRGSLAKCLTFQGALNSHL